MFQLGSQSAKQLCSFIGHFDVSYWTSLVVGQVRHPMALPVVAPKAAEQRRHVTPAWRRTALQVALALTSYSAFSCAAAVGGRCAVGYRSTQLRVRGKRAPVSLWYPARAPRERRGASSSEPKPYRHFISVAKIVEVLQGTELPEALGWEYQLEAGEAVFPDALPIPAESQETELQQRRVEQGLAVANCAVIFAHGYLGSRFDMLHLCEKLALRGFVCASADFAEGLSGAVPRQIARQEIVQELILRLRSEFDVQHLGIVGHSAGGGTATALPGEFRCGRVAVAGLAPGYSGGDPLLAVASEGDGVVRLPRVLQALPEDMAMQDLGNFDASSSRRLGILLRQPLTPRAAGPPCHISFLSEESNQAMISLLTPLLPVAQMLDVPVLDFDAYLKLKDSRDLAKVLLPVIEEFFSYHASRAEKMSHTLGNLSGP
eukprot:s3282_g2.t1